MDRSERAVRTVNGAEILEAIKDSDAVIAIVRIFSGMHLVAEFGQRFSYHDPLVRADPSAFIPVLRPGVDPAAAMRCIAAIDMQSDLPGADPSHTRRLAWPGELLNRTDDLVCRYPDRFVAAEESR
jgi:hypothetical protein